MKLLGRHRFDNGYGASVIDWGYGSHAGLKELAVIHDNEHCGMTDIGDSSGIVGWLTDDEVRMYLDKLKALPETTTCSHRVEVPA